MHCTWRSKELRCQSNKYQAASEAGELEIFASPRPLSPLLHTLWARSLHQFEFSKCKNVAIIAIVCFNVFFVEKTSQTMAKSLNPKDMWTGNLSLC